MAFRVGQQVVAIKTHFNEKCRIGVVTGEIYTIRRIMPWKHETLLAFEEHPPCPYAGPADVEEYGWQAWGFRPLQETGMSILYGLIKTKDEKELVE